MIEMIKKWPKPVQDGLSILATCLIFYALIASITFCVSFLHGDGSYMYDEQTEDIDAWHEFITP